MKKLMSLFAVCALLSVVTGCKKSQKEENKPVKKDHMKKDHMKKDDKKKAEKKDHMKKDSKKKDKKSSY